MPRFSYLHLFMNNQSLKIAELMTKMLNDATAGCFLQEDQQGLLHRLHPQEPFRQDPKEGLESQARRRHPQRSRRAEKLRAARRHSPLLGRSVTHGAVIDHT